MPNDTDLIEKTVFELSQGLNAKEFSSLELTKAYIEQIQAKECDIKAYLTLNIENALSTAQYIDHIRAKGEVLPPLAGSHILWEDSP